MTFTPVKQEELDKYTVEELKEGIVQEALQLIALLKPLEPKSGDMGTMYAEWSMNGLDEVVWRANYLDQKGHGYKGDLDALNEIRDMILHPDEWRARYRKQANAG